MYDRLLVTSQLELSALKSDDLLLQQLVLNSCKQDSHFVYVYYDEQGTGDCLHLRVTSL